ncbi:hypothetical protein TIFTF001_027661 [Ficus carica]|uniref:Uncharacterized protein n=1 Tax=Ficus carica TaxID=3494 RepID=A0AA88DNF1_FICCA|nr:hypothetical protein TIFTF001_025973 [Ficus carica]GMN58557.1 hypothetical protein TIFTF001_027661 [Ficus carica]
MPNNLGSSVKEKEGGSKGAAAARGKKREGRRCGEGERETECVWRRCCDKERWRVAVA